MTKLLSFHNDPAIKEKYVNRVKLHYQADEIIKGRYWDSGKGCAVGCTVHSDKHGAYENELGISWRLALVEDSLFEKLPNEIAKEFPLQFLQEMPIGVDTDLIFKKFVIWNLSDEKEGLIYHIKVEDKIKFLTEIADTYKKSLTEEIDNSVWVELAKKAACASNSASACASASAYAYAYDTAYASAYACASNFASAYAYATAYASAYASATATAYASAEYNQKFTERILRMHEVLFKLIKEAK